MAQEDLDFMLVSRIEDIDNAAKQVERIEQQIFTAIDREIETWAEEQGWTGYFEFTEDELYLAPLAWGEEDDQYAWFYLDWMPGDTGSGTGAERYFYLSRLAGIGGSSLCLWFGQKEIGARPWKALARKAAEDGAFNPFSLSDSANFYLPVTFNQDALAAAVRDDDFTDVLEPLRAALNQALKTQPAFDRLIKSVEPKGKA